MRRAFLFALLAFLATAASIGSAIAFTDTAGTPYATAIDSLTARGIIGGFPDGTFGPQRQVTRQQFAKMVVLTFALPVSEADVVPFGDVQVGGYADPFFPDNYIAVCASNDITKGTTPSTFSPGTPIKRAQLLTMVVRAADRLKPGALTTPAAGYAGSLPGFTDQTHAANLRKAESNGLLAGLVGFGAQWDPWAPATRGEVAQILYNLLNVLAGGAGDPNVHIQDPYIPPQVNIPHLGSLSFSVDQSVSAVSADATADKETVLQLTDRGGWTWRLVVPKGALRGPRTLTMKALTGITSPDIHGALRSGVQLEPDGLLFVTPATLTVSGAGMGGQTFILTSTHDGAAADPALPTHPAVPGSALISHFSNAAADDPTGQTGQIIADFRRQAAAAIAPAKALVKQQDIPVPVPPTLQLECNDEILDILNQELVGHFAKEAGNPENDLISALVGVLRQGQILGIHDPAFEEQANGLVASLIARNEKKALSLIRTYRGQPDKSMAITPFVVGVLKNAELLGATGAPEHAQLLSGLGSYLESLLKPMLDDYKNKHDYRKFGSIMLVAKQVALVGSDDTAQEAVNKLFAATQFDVETTFTLDYPEQEWLLKGTVHVALAMNTTTGHYTTEGTGSGSYVSYTGAKSVPMSGSDYPMTVTLKDFKPCEGTATVTIDRHYADTEQYQVGEDPISLGLVKVGWESIFKQYQGDGGYSFPVTVRNEQAVVIDDTLDGISPSGKVTGTVNIKVTHTPGG